MVLFPVYIISLTGINIRSRIGKIPEQLSQSRNTSNYKKWDVKDT